MPCIEALELAVNGRAPFEGAVPTTDATFDSCKVPRMPEWSAEAVARLENAGTLTSKAEAEAVLRTTLLARGTGDVIPMPRSLDDFMESAD